MVLGGLAHGPLHAHPLKLAEARLQLEHCRAVGSPDADRLAASLARFERRAARFLAEGRRLATTGLDAEQLQGLALPAEDIARQMQERRTGLLAHQAKRRADLEQAHEDCRLLAAYGFDGLVEGIYPARTDPRYRW